MSIISAKTAKRIALTCLIVVVSIPILLVLLVWGSIKTDPYRYDYPEHLKTDDLRVTYEQFDPNLIYLTACNTVNRSLEGYSGASYRYAALPDTDTAEYLAMYEANSFFAASFTPQIVRAAGSDDHPILDGTVTAELYLRKEHARDSWSWNSDEDEHHTYGQIVYHSHVSPVTDASLLGEILTVVGTPARMEELEFKRIRGDMLGMPPDEVKDYIVTIHPDGHDVSHKNTWGYEPVTDGQGHYLYLRLTVAEHPNIAWDAAVYVNSQGQYALRRRVYVRPSTAYDEPYAFRGDEYELYYPLSVSLDGYLPAEWLPSEWETAPETSTDTTADTAP
ncbi:MAG: hypothetical protein IKU90_07330 [Clostridia bacterium]|nr:hypothetical protein [Clostridia bacterium]